MSLKIKALGLSLVAVFAMSAVSIASAQAAEFHSEAQHTFLFGEQVTENVFTTPAGKVKCKKASFTSGEETGTGSGTNWHKASVEVTPAYSECTAFGQAATVATTGCKYKLTASSSTAGNATIVCETGKTIVVTVTSGNCGLTIGAQTPTTSTVDYANGGTGTTRDVLVTATVSGITYTKTGTGTICGSSGTTASYAGSVTEKGYTSAAHTTEVGIWVE